MCVICKRNDVFLAEISPVQYKADLFVFISYCLVHHTLELGYIINAARIYFIEQRLLVMGIIRYHGNRDCEIHSYMLCRILAAQHHWDLNCSYRIPGRVYPDQHLAVFDLSSASKLSPKNNANDSVKGQSKGQMLIFGHKISLQRLRLQGFLKAAPTGFEPVFQP